MPNSSGDQSTQHYLFVHRIGIVIIFWCFRDSGRRALIQFVSLSAFVVERSRTDQWSKPFSCLAHFPFALFLFSNERTEEFSIHARFERKKNRSETDHNLRLHEQNNSKISLFFLSSRLIQLSADDKWIDRQNNCGSQTEICKLQNFLSALSRRRSRFARSDKRFWIESDEIELALFAFLFFCWNSTRIWFKVARF